MFWRNVLHSATVCGHVSWIIVLLWIIEEDAIALQYNTVRSFHNCPLVWCMTCLLKSVLISFSAMHQTQACRSISRSIGGESW